MSTNKMSHRCAPLRSWMHCLPSTPKHVTGRWISPRVMRFASKTHLPCSIRYGQHILAMSKDVLPQSVAGKACSYTLALWNKLTHFLHHPELELSNNLAANSMRTVVTRRRNSIHIGSEQ